MNLAEVTGRVLQLAHSDTCFAIAKHINSADVRWANSTVTTSGQHSEDFLNVVAINKGGVGTFSANITPKTNLSNIVKEAERLSYSLPKAEDYSPPLSGSGKWPAGVIYSSTSAKQITKLLPDLEKLLNNSRTLQLAAYGYAEHTTDTTYLASSTGVRKKFQTKSGHYSISLKSQNQKHSAWIGLGKKDFSRGVLDASYQQLLHQYQWGQKRLNLPAGRYEVILSPSAVADLLLYAYETASAREADEGRSVYSSRGPNALGKLIAHSDVSLYSDPSEPGMEVLPFVVATASRSYQSVFDNGLDIERTDWVRNGVLKNLITTRHWADKHGRQPVPYTDNLIFPAQGADIEQMIRSSNRALLVTCLWYIREVDPSNLLLTGLTRDGVYLIEAGEVKGAVNNFRFNVSPIEMLKSILEIGESVPAFGREFGEYLPFTKMPPLRIKDFNMSSVSDAI